MKQHCRTFRKIAVPMAVLLPLLWLMVGCFYVPWFEHRTDADRRPNVRAMVGPADSQRQLRPGYVTRASVHALLGRPEYASLDDKSEGYVNRTSFGFWVFPLCFTAYDAGSKTYVVRINYDAKEMMTSYEWADATENALANGDVQDSVVEKLNRTGPRLYAR